MLIAGDVGGTKTDLAIFSSEAGPHSPFAQAQVRSADYPNLQKIVTEFLAKVNKPVDRACSAVPGPVIEGRVKTTNLPWVIEESALAQELNLDAGSVHLINDLEPVARAVPILGPSDWRRLMPANPFQRGPSPLLHLAPAWASPFLLGMEPDMSLTAPRVVIQTLRQPTRGRFTCSYTCSNCSIT
jgi:glucokinase